MTATYMFTIMTPETMKPRLRFPLVLLLPLLLFAVAFSFHTAARRDRFSSPAFHENPSLFSGAGTSVNDTLIRLAAVDDSEPEIAQNVEDLLGGTLQSVDLFIGRRIRSLSIWRRRRPEEQESVSMSRLGFPVRSEAPDHSRMFPEFKRLLYLWFGRRRQQFQPEVMTQLLERVKRPIDVHYGYPDTGRPYATCAVVGNSGVLLNSEYGDLIDSHDFVIRLNNARVDRFQRHVGAKTSISFINSNVLRRCATRDRCFCHPYGEFIPVVIYICQPAHFLEFMVCNASHRSPLLVTDPQFDTLCARIVKYYSLKTFVEETGKQPAEWGKHHDEKMFHYSSGMQAVMLAVGICDKVSLFGFGKSAAAKHHYHTQQKAELDLHHYEAEYAFYRDLAGRPQAVPFFKDAGVKVPPVVFYQ